MFRQSSFLKKSAKVQSRRELRSWVQPQCEKAHVVYALSMKEYLKWQMPNFQTKTRTEGPPPTGGTAANGGATVELSPDQKAKLAMLEQEIKDKQNANSNAFIAQHEAMKKENELLREQNAAILKQLAETDYQKRVAELEHQVRAISSQPVIHTTITASRGTHRASAELGSGDFPNYSVRDFGSD